ncbi:MAG: 1-acyl-sn-glycerol-3-phosphate acyltransferase [Bacteroidetes bacterium]|nr:1-acyl-sn-glycerol-3-phosphate acyltransferase [Bacteroidota bacterium]
MSILRDIANRIYSGWCIVIFFVVIFFQMLGFIAISVLPERQRTVACYRVARAIATAWFFLCGYKIVIEGEEKIDHNQTYMFVCNHSNMLDLPMIAYFLQHYYKSLAKKELRYVPIMGYLLRTSSLLVDRSNPESRRQTTARVANLMKQGLSILIFPEGTRNKTVKPLKEFYSGAFRTAILAQVPVQPFLFLDHRSLQPVHSYRFHPGTVRVRVLDAIPTAGLHPDDAHDLQQQIYDLMERAILTGDKDFAQRAVT